MSTPIFGSSANSKWTVVRPAWAESLPVRPTVRLPTMRYVPARGLLPPAGVRLAVFAGGPGIAAQLASLAAQIAAVVAGAAGREEPRRLLLARGGDGQFADLPLSHAVIVDLRLELHHQPRAEKVGRRRAGHVDRGAGRHGDLPALTLVVQEHEGALHGALERALHVNLFRLRGRLPARARGASSAPQAASPARSPTPGPRQ